MKKTIIIAALSAIMFIASSATDRNAFGTAPGSVAPMLVVNDSDKAFSLESMRGRYVLLSFWSSTDAPSRVAMNRYQKAARSGRISGNVTCMAVNLDSSKSLFREIVRRDGLDMNAQIGAAPADVDGIVADFNLGAGYGTFLIDPEGRISTLNPEITDLIEI